MSSEFSCSYCSASPRHPCYSTDEAAHCPNQTNRGMYLEMDKSDVVTWIRYNIGFLSDAERAKVEEACEIIEREF